jgi:outer membrane protein TolC
MIRFPVLLFLLFTSIAALGQAQVESLTLEQAVSMALRDNLSIRSAMLEVEKTEDRRAIARMAQFPKLDVNLLESQPLTRIDFRIPQGVFGNYAGAGPIPARDTLIGAPRQPTMYLSAQAAQPLSQLHRIRLGMQMEELRGKVEQEKIRAERQQVVIEVKRIYYELLALQSALEATEENLKLYRELDRVVGEYVVEKVVLKSEGLDVKAQLALEEHSSMTLRNGLESQKEQLNALLGRDVRLDFRAQPVLAGASFHPDLKSAHERALSLRPEVMRARLQLQQAELDQRIKKSQSIPDISLAVSYLRIAPVGLIPPNIATVGVSVSWEPFDWGRKKRELSEKNKSMQQSQLAVRAAETKTVLEVNAVARKLQESRSMLRAAQFLREAAHEKLRVATARFAEHATLLKEVLQAQASVADTSQKYQQAVLAFWKARAEFEKVIGEE